MVRYILRRFLSLIPVIMILYIVSFSLIHLIPGDAAMLMVGSQGTATQVEKVRHILGLDKPFYKRLYDSFIAALHGDLGDTVFSSGTVSEILAKRVPVSVYLATYSLMLSLTLGLSLGIIAAIWRNSLADRLVSLLSTLGLAIPGFWLGLILIYIFALHLGWFRTGGYVPLQRNVLASLNSMTLPAFSIGVSQAAFMARMTRSSMLEVIYKDYITTARSKGATEKSVIFRHVLRNAAIPIITIAGLSFGSLLGVSVIAEVVFTIPGIGTTLLAAVQQRDFALVQGIILFIGVSYSLINFIIDLVYSLIDPRITYE